MIKMTNGNCQNNFFLSVCLHTKIKVISDILITVVDIFSFFTMIQIFVLSMNKEITF